MILVVVTVIILFILYFFTIGDRIKLYGNSREYFGGPVKSLKRIPKNDCHGICRQIYTYRLANLSTADPGYAYNRYTSCVNTCNHNNYLPS